jgi:hypothetical protein
MASVNHGWELAEAETQSLTAVIGDQLACEPFEVFYFVAK